MNHLLYLVHRIPYPPNKGDKLRSYHLLKELSKSFHVHLGCFVDQPDDWRHVPSIRQMCADAYFAPLHGWLGRIRGLRGLMCGEPMGLGYFRSRGLQQWVNTQIDQLRIRHIVVFSSVMAQYVEHAGEARRVADMVDVDSAKWTQYAEQTQGPLSWIYAREGRTLLAYERRICESFDATLFVSNEETRLFDRLARCRAGNVVPVPNGVDSEFFDPCRSFECPYPAGTQHLVFTGAMDYRPNADAVEWFATHVLPQVRKRWPDLRFAIVGSNPGASVRALERIPGVWVTGTVADVRPYLAHAVVAVAPLRIARGVQNKVLEAMAMGRVVIASTGAATGIEATPGFDLFVADTPDQYIEAIAAALHPECEIGQRARARVVDSYSWQANLKPVLRLLLDKTTPSGATDERVSAAA